MPWQTFVNYLVGTGFVSKTAICGLDGSIWGKSDNFQLEPSEASTTANGFKAPNAVLGSGLMFEGQKYTVLQADGEQIIGKKNANGFFVYKTAQAFIISIYEDGVQPEMCSKTTKDMAAHIDKTVHFEGE